MTESMTVMMVLTSSTVVSIPDFGGKRWLAEYWGMFGNVR